MQKTKLISQVIPAVMLSFVATLGSEQIVQAEPSVSLLQARCANTGPGRWRRDSSNVAVGRAVYKSILHLGPGNSSVAMTCNIVPKGYSRYFQTLQLEFGMQDNDTNSPANTVNIYLDGDLKYSRALTSGQKESVPLNVTNVSNIAIETVCSSKSEYCGRVYVFKASLEPIPPPPKPENTPVKPENK